MADKKFTLTFDANMDVSKVKKSVSEIQSALNGINLSKGMASSASGTFKKLLEELDNYNNLTSQAATSMADIKKADKSLQTILALFDKINNIAEEVGADPINFINSAELKKINAAKKALEGAKQAMSNTAVAVKKANLQDQFDKAKKKVDDLNNQVGQLNNKISSKKAAKIGIETSLEKAREDLALLRKELANLEANPVKAETKTTSKKGVKTTENLNAQEVENYKNKVNETRAKISETERAITQLNKDLQFTDTSKMEEELEQIEQKMKEATQAMNELGEKLKHVGKDNRAEAIKKLRDELVDLTGKAKKDIPQTIDKIEEFIQSLSQAEKVKVTEALNKMNAELAETARESEKAAKGINKTTKEGEQLSRAAQDVENLKNQVLDFFSISNTIQIFKNAIRVAFDTVKELDAAMTETAVVTDFSIGDMWDKLPQYSEEATKLGASIKSLYEATTLYYQQGLNSEQAMGVGIETMKMARIANMDAAQATEAMTAALRGFNMEINETSAGRINDVYSELAAITAADTSQIATAMSKTASIAESANMEFETTAALLAQIIETTQEAPETAGTAMKTIIARFTEVKQLFSEGMLTGEDSEGEEININKIDAALKTVGISLKDFLNGTKGIDDIFLELASKWDTFDLATQRYIATTAAGSRQQSRFLAMMGNYGRTMELVTAANNSAGASQKQFDKTLESLDTKLQRLKNAWAEFTMGLANSEVIKVAVDLLTSILEKLNQFTDFGSDGFGGVMTTLTRLVTVIMGLKSAEPIIKGLLKSLEFFKFGEGAEESMGIIKALFTKMSAQKGGFGKFSSELKEANSVLGVTAGKFGAAEGGAAAFGKSLAALGPYIAILVTIGAAVYGIVKSFKAAQSEAKLDNINQALEDLNTEAQNAQEELNNIGSARTELNGLQDTLNGLTKGTSEWKSALVDVNKQVLELIEKYPSLEYELGANGALQIKQESWDNLLAQQQQVITNMTAQRLDLESQRANIVKNIDFEKFVVDSYGTDTAEVNRAARRANRQALRQNKDYRNAIIQDTAIAGAGNVYVEETEQSKVKNQLEDYLVDEQVMGQTKFERWMAQAEMDMAQWYQNSPLLAWLTDGANAASGNIYIEESETAKRQRLLNENENYYVDEVAEKLVGLNQTEMTALAAEFAREGENSQTVDQAKFIEMLETATDKEWTNDAAEKLLNSIKEFDKATNSFNDLIQTEIENQSSQESLTRQFTMNALTGSPIMEKDYADSIVNIISKGEKEAISAQVNAKADELEASYKDENGNWKNLEELAAEYARINGFQAVGKEVYRDGTYSEKLDTSPEAMIRALATEAITVEVKEKAEKTAGAIGKEEEQEKLFDNLFSTDGQEITSAQRQKYYKNDEVDFDQLAKDLGIFVDAGEEAFVKLGEEFEILPEDLKAMMESNFEKSEIRAKKQRSSTANSIAQYATGTKLNAGNIYGSIEKIEKNFTDTYSDIEVRDILDSALSALSKTGDNKLIQNGILELMDAGLANDIDKFTEISQFIDKVNWNDPVEAVSRLNREIKIGSGVSKEFAQNLLDLNSSYLGDASQLKAFLKSDEYTEVSNKLAEIKEVQGEITAADVNELASEYNYLNKMIKNTQMSSKSLASVLDDITDGTLAFEDINDVLIAGIKNLGSFEDSLDSILKYLSEFNPGRDEGEAQDFLDTASEIVTERVENLEYNNTEARSYITELLGKDYLKGTVEEQIAAIDAAKTWLESITGSAGAGMQVFKNIADGKDVMGNAIAGGQEKIDGIDYGYNDQGKFYMDIDASKYKTLDEVTQAFADSNLGGSKTLWDTMFTLLSNFDLGFAQDWEVEQAGQAGARMHEEAVQIDGKALVNEKTIQNAAEKLYEAVGDVTGKSVDDFVTDIKKGLEESGGYQTFDVLNVDGTRKDLQTLKSEIEALFGGLEGEEGLLSRYIDLDDDTGISSFDFTGLANGLQTLGLTAEESLETAYDYIQKLPEEVKQLNIDGQEVNLFNTDGTKKSIEELKEEAESLKKAAEIESTVAINTAAATSKVRSYIAELDEIPRDIVTHTSVEQIDEVPTGNGGGQQITKAATGTINHPRSELALTGEEGPELVETEDGAYLVGMEGPQMAYINKGDTVHTAEETAEIYKRKGVSIQAYGQGQDGKISSILDLDKIINGGSGGTNVGSKSDDDKEDWKNPFDKLYNLVRKIDEELRQRERIERRHEKLLENLNVSANKIINVSREELAQLERERMLQEQLISGRKYQIDQYQSENADLTKYARVVQNDRGEDVLRINWDLINSITDTEEGDRIEKYVSQLEDWFDDLDSAEKTLWDIEDAVEEIKERGKDEYFKLEDAIKEALVQSYQDEIDKLSQINDSINDTNASLLDAIQKSVDKQRQDRNNQRVEDDLAEKQRRLLYLQQDTSGANAMEILQLQKEIEEGQQDYTDTLIDQKISELQEQNDEAAKQREQQITIAQAQLDHYIETGRIWNDVYALMDEGLDKDTGLVRGSRLEEILKSSEGFAGMSEIAKMEWLKDTNNMIAQGLAYLEVGRQLEDIGVSGDSQIEFTTADGRTLTGTVNPDGSVTASDGQTYNNVFQGYDGKYYAGENIADVEEPKAETPPDDSDSTTTTTTQKENPYGVASSQGNYTVRGHSKDNYMSGTGVKAIQWALNDMDYNAGTIDGIYGYTTHFAVQDFQRDEGIQVDGDFGPETREKMRLRGYKTGGLADFTGPAWLDGTKTHPELVLNARDTQNFIQLKDILASVLERGATSNTSTENNGDVTYDIDINVESIGSDYDIEQVANKVKSMIGENARYRNNNTVSLAR